MFTPNSLVLTTTGRLPINQIFGDFIASANGDVYATSAMFGLADTFIVGFSDGRYIQCDEAVGFFDVAKNRWVNVQQLSPGMIVGAVNEIDRQAMASVSVKSVSPCGLAVCWKLCSSTDTAYVDDILVHCGS